MEAMLVMPQFEYVPNEWDRLMEDRTAAKIAMMFVGTDKASELEVAILRHMEHHIKMERERCARTAKLHKCYVRDYSRDVFARAIADKIKSGVGPTEQERRFAQSVKWEPE